MKDMYEQAQSGKEILPLPVITIRREPNLEKISATISKFEYVGDEEAVLMLALAAGHPDWRGDLLGQVKSYKPHVKNPEQLLSQIENAIANAENSTLPEGEIDKWKQDLPELRHRISKVLSFFDPQRTSGIEQVTIIPSNAMLNEEEGKSFHVAGETLIMSRTGALKNVEHEFLHGIINPIMEKLWPTLTAEDRLMVKQLASKRLVADYETPESILNEELIRTYVDYFEESKPPLTFDDSKRQLGEMNEKQFQNLRETKKNILTEMGISSLAGLRAGAQEYYGANMKDDLKNRIYDFYTKFQSDKTSNPNLDFRDFLEKNLRTLLRE